MKVYEVEWVYEDGAKRRLRLFSIVNAIIVASKLVDRAKFVTWKAVDV